VRLQASHRKWPKTPRCPYCDLCGRRLGPG
jgi:hypothetical protein